MTDQPRRIQQSRRKGSRLPPNTVVVSRPSKYGNPHAIGPGFTAADAVAAFRFGWRDANAEALANMRADLAGKNLACWCHLCARHKALGGKPLLEHCPDCDPCHVDPLGELANKEPS